jgi:hypothetical protein
MGIVGDGSAAHYVESSPWKDVRVEGHTSCCCKDTSGDLFLWLLP